VGDDGPDPRVPDSVDPGDERRPPFLRRRAMSHIRREAARHPSEPLESDDWMAMWSYGHSPGARALKRIWRTLPHGPRCGMCSAPFAGVGRFPARALGFRPSRKNPTFCATCVELAPPGGATMQTGVFFADVRGFTSSSEHADPADVAKALRRFYGCAESVLFPEAIIDKLIGDEVMALYLGPILPERDIPRTMVDHATALLDAIGYGTPAGPFLELGIGLDFGEAFVGNIGDRAVFDFTAVGDVVNTASRLQGQAAGGEIVMSERVAAHLDPGLGEPFEVDLKGKSERQSAVRLRRPG
jgi:adenylate cyclase